MSRSTNREYSSTDISSVTGYKTKACASKILGARQPELACYPSETRSKKCESQKDSISEVTINNTIYSSKSTQKRRVIRCKDANDEEMVTYHLKLKPESLRYTFSTTKPKKIKSEKHLNHESTSRLAYHSRQMELSSHESSFSQNHQYGSSREKSYDEKTTNCRPVINLNTVEFVERTIDKNNRLKHLVRDIVEAREKEKKLEAWNNYINELKNKHANNYYGTSYVPEKNQLQCDNILYHYNFPCQCTSISPWSTVNDDYFDVAKPSDYIMNSYPNEFSCYPISSAARRLKKKSNEPPTRPYVKTEYIINAEEENPRKRKRKQLSNNQVRNISAQTSTGIGPTSNDTDSRNQTGNNMKDELEGYEPCICAAESVRDSGTNTDKVESETVTDIKKHATSQACFCNKDQSVIVTKNEIPILSNDSSERKQCELERTATFETVTEKMTKLKEELGQSKTCDNSLGIIEEKLDNIISTMNDLLVEVKLRINDMSTEKFDTATSTIFPQINKEYETCIANKLLEQEIKIPKVDNAKQKERYNLDLFQNDKGKIDTAQSNATPTPTKNITELNGIPTSTKNTTLLNATPATTENKARSNSIVAPAEYNKLDTIIIPKEDTAPLNATPASTKNKAQSISIVSPLACKELHAIIIPKEDRASLNATPAPTENKPRLNSILTPSEHKKLDAIKIPKEDTALLNGIPISVNNTDATTINIDEKTHAESNKKAEVPEKLEKKSLGLVTDPTISLIHSPGKGHLISNDGKSVGKSKPVEDPQPSSSQPKDDDLSNVEQSVIDLKKASKTFMSTLHRSGPNLTEDEINKKPESLTQKLKAKFSSKAHHAKHSKEEKQEVKSIPENNKGTKENSDQNHTDNNKNSKKNPKDQEFCCVYANLKSMPRSQYRHASVTASLDKEVSNAAEIILDVYYSNNVGNDQTINKRRCALVDRVVSKIDETNTKTNDKSINTKLRIAVDRAVSKIDENTFSKNHPQNYISVDRAVSKIDDIIIEEINKSNQAKKDINEILNREFTNNYGVQITFELPTKERGTEVTDSLSKTRISRASSSQGRICYGKPSRRTPLTIAAVNTDPMSLLGLFRLSTDTVRQLLTFINFDYSSYLPSVNRALPTVSEAMQYLCHICGAAFRRPSELSSHMKSHNLDSAKDCCVCRHILHLRQRNPGVFACRFCGQCFTRAYCCELHERTCGRRRGRRLDVSDSRAILT